MATQDLTKAAAGASYAAKGLDRFYLLENTVDFSDSGTYTAADVLQMLDIKAGSIVLVAGIQVQTVEDSTATIDLGDGDNADGYLDGTDVEAATGYFASIAAYTIDETNSDLELTGVVGQLLSVVGGKLYTANDTIDLLINNTCDTGKVRVWAWVLDCSPTN